MATLLFTDESLREHQPGPHHPECPERLEAVMEGLEGANVDRFEPARLATVDELSRVHTPGYVDYILGLHGAPRTLDPDTSLSPGSVTAARLAAGLSLSAVEAVLRDKVGKKAFVAARPPGHHAERDAAMGFCVFNNMAIAAEHARELGAQRVLVVDWDVHHGNGTHHHFYDRSDVLFFDAHRYPYYPGSGALEEVGRGAGLGYTVNAPLPPGLGDGDYCRIFEETLVPVAHAFKPDIVLISAGFDAHRDDPLGDQRVSDDGFAALTGIVSRLADEVCDGRLVMLLEGGYDLKALSRSVRSCVDVLGGRTAPEPRDWSRHAEVLTRAMRRSASRFFDGLES